MKFTSLFSAFTLSLFFSFSGILLATPDWKTIETQHFKIHYMPGESALSRQTAEIAEQVHDQLTRVFQWEPKEKTHLVLNNRNDIANGSATMFPQNRMELFVAPPDDIRGTEDFEDRLVTLLTHEYTHILHLDKVGGNASYLRTGFGRFLLSFPARFQPIWVIEGLATYQETDHESEIGRGQSSYYRMLMRMEILHGFKPFRQANQPIATWPSGTTPYLYGVWFFKFLRDQYGEEKIREWVEAYSENLIPFKINSTAKAVFGKDLYALWNEFERYLRTTFEKEVKNIIDQGISQGVRLTTSGYQTSTPKQMETNDFYFYENDQLSHGKLMKLSTEGGTAKEVAKVYGSRFDVHPESGILIVQLTPEGKDGFYADLYRIDPESGESQRLTQKGRYRFAVWSPDGKSILATRHDHGISELYRLDGMGQNPELLWKGESREILSWPTISPNGKFLIASVKRPGTTWNLERFSIDTGKWSRLTENRFIEGHPHIDKSGDLLYYTADYNRVFNLYQMNLNTGKIRQITNLIGGGFQPFAATDGKSVIYQGSVADGFDLFQLDLSKATTPWQEVPIGNVPKKESSEPAQKRAAVAPFYEESDYSPWGSLAPNWWFPLFSFGKYSNLAGIITSAGDPLSWHSYFLFAGYDSKNDFSNWNFDYSYKRWRVRLHLRSRGFLNYIDQDREDADPIIRKEYENALIASLPVNNLSNSWNFSVGVAQYELFNPEEVDRTIGGAISYSTVKQFSRTISPSEGWSSIVTIENSDALPGDFKGTRSIWSNRGYWDLGRRHVLTGTLALGVGDKGGRDFTLNTSSVLYEQPAGNSLFTAGQIPVPSRYESSSSLQGERLLLSSLEWRFPLLLVERGLTTPPVGIHQLHGSLFTAVGDTWNSDGESFDAHRAIGATLTAETVLGYQLPFNVSLQVTKELDHDKELSWRFIFSPLL